jgi:hypothetical protein
MINVYYSENGGFDWVWHDLFLEIVLYMRDQYNANIIRRRGASVPVERYQNCLVWDSDLLIEDIDNDIVKGISFRECRPELFRIFTERNNKNDILLLTQFYNIFSRNTNRSDFGFNLKPTTFYPFNSHINYDYWYHERMFIEYDTLIDKMFFGGSIRGDIPRLQDIGLVNGLVNETLSLDIDRYLDMAIHHKIGLSINGAGEVCHREIEYMAIGLPNLRLEYMTQLDPPLIPDYHYISIPRGNFPWDTNYNRDGGPEYVEAYKKRFLEVKDDREFLSFIVKNARDYYTAYCSPHNRLAHVLRSLEL